MLDIQNFKNIIKHTPLVSIDICLVCNNQILLGKRNNMPLQGKWFTPGGRILKNESWQECLKRIAKAEMGIIVNNFNDIKLMGIWDHFYSNSAVGENISTHYVNLPHSIKFNKKPDINFDDQHEQMQWFDLNEIANDPSFYKYIQEYALWHIKLRIDG